MELIHSSIGKKLYRDGDKLVKSFDESYSKAGILNEALNQARVEETSLNIPKVLGVSVIDGKWSLVWEYIEGETLESLMKKHPAKEDEYLNLFLQRCVTICTSVSTDCPATKSSATAISNPATLLLRRTVPRILSTGRTRRRGTVRRMRQERILFSSCRRRMRSQKSI